MNKTYIIITPAYNEEDSIELTIKSVIRQTTQPLQWIIVDDGSTDKTGEIINNYADRYDFIQYHRRIRDMQQSYYASNVYAILEGYEKISNKNYEYLAILDADIELCCNYYEKIIQYFEINPQLGVAAGTYLENIDGTFKEAVIDRRSTPKAIQVFRRSCYEQIGGFIPCSNGGEDSCTEIMARMNGWQTWSFPGIRTLHKKPVGTGDGRSILSGRFRLGLTDYTLATHPVFMFAKCIRRCFVEKPYVLSGIYRFAGFLTGYVKQEEKHIIGKAKKYIRKEQLSRLLQLPGIRKNKWIPLTDEIIQ